jgi:hypothetical protein
MVYTPDFLNTILDNNQNTFSAQTTNNKSVVTIKFRGKKIPENGPTPLVDISTSVETNSLGLPESLTTRITLTGKIVRPQTDNPTGSGISHVLSGIKEITDIAQTGDIGGLNIECGTTNPSTLYSLENCKILSVEFNKTSDNWIQTADYSVVFEANKSAISGYSVKNISDSWSIEPLEDYTYSSYAINDISQKQEYHNPNLKPAAATVSDPQPAAN